MACATEKAAAEHGRAGAVSDGVVATGAEGVTPKRDPLINSSPHEHPGSMPGEGMEAEGG